MNVTTTDLTAYLRWPRGERARVWFAQPRLRLTGQPPFIPLRQEPDPTGLDLLRSIVERERALGPDDDTRFARAPSLILLPEYSIAPADYLVARDLARSAPRNSLVVFGLGQMTEAEARAIEPEADLWQGGSAGRYTNCAVVAIGGAESVYLQPKILAAKEEEGIHWPGKIVRYFFGRNVQFVVLVCSEFLDRAEHRTTADAIVDRLLDMGRALNLVETHALHRAACIFLAEEERSRDPLSDDVWLGRPVGLAVPWSRYRTQARSLGANRHCADFCRPLVPAADTRALVNAARDPARSLCTR